MQGIPIQAPPTAWYREPWPWLLMLGPVSVIVAGVITSVVAFRGADGLIAEDYYKQGLSINRMLEREQRAAALGVKAQLQYVEAEGVLRAEVSASKALPAVLSLRLMHPTRAAMDQSLFLRQVSPGSYEVQVKLPAGRWHIALETPEWRVASTWAGGASVVLDGRQSTN